MRQPRQRPDYVAHDSTEADPEALRNRLHRALAGLICEDEGERPCRKCRWIVRRQVNVVAGALMVAAFGKLKAQKNYHLAGRGVLHLLKAAGEAEGGRSDEASNGDTSQL